MTDALDGPHWTSPARLERSGAPAADFEVQAGGERRFVSVAPGQIDVVDGRLRARPRPQGSEPEASGPWFLGRIDGVAWFAEPVLESGLADLRLVLGGLEAAEAEIAAAAVALATWHADTGFCDRCGAPTRAASLGWTRHCTGCGREHFPRTDPAVIVAIVDAEDRLLLGRQRVWPEGRVSIFAGFVEAGESLEQAAWREIAEETGVQLTSLEYRGSQPWPFPRSLMVGFRATAAVQPAVADGVEIDWARWFTRAELAVELDAGRLQLPGSASIAHRLISEWRAGR